MLRLKMPGEIAISIIITSKNLYGNNNILE